MQAEDVDGRRESGCGAERLKYDEWIIVKVHDELQHFHTPDFRGQRGRESLELGHVHSGQAHRKRIRSWVGYGPPFSLLTGILDLPPLQELKLQSFGSC